ncbi:MAG: AarF/UbiB family protein [Chitinivibrionales bacterium]|nr:AarF/UbiB family protein [Chitinivibrionales bacterium]
MQKRRKSLHIGRYGEILSVFIKYGFGDIVSSLNIGRYLSLTRGFLLRKSAAEAHAKLTHWQRVRMALEELGPTFIKFGQFMSNRPDVLPVDLIYELEKLQGSVRPFPKREAETIIQGELRRPIPELFSFFPDAPIAAASVAQVYKATLTNGRTVAVKVQRPGIAQVIEQDIDILFDAVKLLIRRYEIVRSIRLEQLVEEFETVIRKELDFSLEMAHLERFRRNFKDDPLIYVPEVFPDLTTQRILVTEFVEGIKVSDAAALAKAHFDPANIAKQGTVLVLRQIFEHGFFHADPHPGNILICNDGRICFLDFGSVGILPPMLRMQLGVVLYGVAHRDPQRIVRAIEKMSNHHFEHPQKLEYDLMEFIEDYAELPLKDMNVPQILQRFASIIVSHEIQIIPGFYLLLKSIITMQAVGTRLDPHFNLFEHLEPFVKRLLRTFPRLQSAPASLYFMLMEFAALIGDLPFETRDMLRMVKAGELTVRFQHRGLEPMLDRFDVLVNKIVFALVLAALIVGSSLVVNSGIPPKIQGIPLIGVVGFITAAVIGFGLLFSMLRNKKMSHESKNN